MLLPHISLQNIQVEVECRLRLVAAVVVIAAFVVVATALATGSCCHWITKVNGMSRAPSRCRSRGATKQAAKSAEPRLRFIACCMPEPFNWLPVPVAAPPSPTLPGLSASSSACFAALSLVPHLVPPLATLAAASKIKQIYVHKYMCVYIFPDMCV